MASYLRNITNTNIGDNAIILQGDIHNHAPPQADPCLADLRITDPRDDKTRIEESKGNLLRDSYCWILDHADFQMWRNDPQCRLLWIKGDPGKGKTMLLCGMINELEKFATYRLSYFFCQATETRLRSATAVLRGLIYNLAVQQPSLISHVREKYDRAGKQLFEDSNAWTALSKILKSILDDPSLEDVVLLIDALDECTEELPRLLNLIREISTTSSYVKWVVSSRNWPNIENELENSEQRIRLCLELNEDSISAAVQTYIRHKVNLLAQKHGYNDNIRESTEQYLFSQANNTFLWVALVCQSLNNVRSRKVIKKLTTYPPGLDSLYERMLDQILKLDDDDDVSLCKQVLAIVSTVYRPVTLHELYSLIGSPEEFSEDISSFAEMIRLCGSFLTIRGDTIYFVHQSAKDHLTTDKVWPTISTSRPRDIHYTIFSQSLQSMNNTLRRDIYCLGTHGYHISQIQLYNPDPLIAVRYSCVHWIDHLHDCDIGNNMKDALQAGGSIDMFLRQHFLHWLEALSLLRCMSEGILAIAKLTGLLEGQTPRSQVLSLAQDARRFIFRNKWVIESTPLQVYVSALIFSPLQSKIRKIFKDEEPSWMVLKPAVEAGWGACLQTLEGHNNSVDSVVFSPDGQRLASGSWDNTVRVWDANLGTCLQTLKGHNDAVYSVIFSPDGQRLASGSQDNTIRVWDANSGTCLQTLEGHNDAVYSVIFSPDSQRVASGSEDSTIRVWDANSGACLQTLEGHNDAVCSIIFSPDSQRLASGSFDKAVRVWDANSGTCLQTLEGHNCSVESAFSPDGQRLASGSSYDNIVRLWDANSGTCLQTLEGHNSSVHSVIFSPNGQRLASGSTDNTVRVWDANSGACLQTLEGHDSLVDSVVFSPDGQRVALSAQDDRTVTMWDANSGTCLQTLEGHNDAVYSIIFSPDGQRLASGSSDNTVRVWDANLSTCLQTLEGHNSSVNSVVFSPDGQRVASSSLYDNTVRLWDANSGTCLQTLEGHNSSVNSVVFSPDGQRVASSSSYDNTVRLWDANSGTCLQTLEGHNCSVESAFSPDGQRLASGSSYDNIVRVWDANSGTCLQTLEGHNYSVYLVIFSPDGQQLASSSRDKTVRVWDVNSGNCLQTLEGHNDWVYSVVFSPDGQRLALSSHNNTVWDTNSGTCLQTLEGHNDSVNSVFSPDSQRLDSSFMVGVWDVNSGACLQIFYICQPIRYLKFDATNSSHLFTDFGVLKLEASIKKITPDVLLQSTDSHKYGISFDKTWFIKDNKPLIWLPPECRPNVFAVFRGTVTIGCTSGRVLVMRFSID